MGSAATRFPDTYREVSTARLLDVYAAGPGRLRSVVADLTSQDMGATPIAGKWSIREIVLHVSDSELVGAVRIRMVWGTKGGVPLLPGYDQDEWSRKLAYRDADSGRVSDALALFSELRALTREVLSMASLEDWDRLATHPETGTVTLRNLLELYADHSERHIEQILERRRLLGTPIDLPSLLPERLY